MKITQKISITSLVLIVSLFVTLTGNVKFFIEVANVYPLAENFGFVVSLLVWLFSFLSILLLLATYRYSVKPILIFVLLSSSIVSYFSNNYGTIFDNNMVTSILETDLAELLDLFSVKMAVYFIFLGVLPSIWIYKLQLRKSAASSMLWSKAKTILVLIIIFVLVTLLFSKTYTSFTRENKQLRLYINPTYFMYAMGKHASNQFKSISTSFIIIGQDATIQSRDNVKKLVIVVVGETARAERFSLNGYERLTNPLLAQQDVISFEQMSSCGTDTAVSLPCMFSSLTKSEYSHSQGKNMSNALDILTTAGVKVLWRDNNSSSKSVADRVEYQDFKSNNINTICDDECRDEGMLVGLQSYMNKHQNQDIMIVLHTMGSHGPAYYKRYPEEFKKYQPVCETNQLNECTDEQINNAYDNTILYTDYFLAKVIELLKNNQKEYKTAMLYMSDHGESLGEKGLYLHGTPYFIAPKEQTHVSSIMWFDDRTAKEINQKKLRRTIKNPTTHDGMFHTLLGLMNVNSTVYDKKMDYLSYEE
jgi:lipid A ethanolaminephosphotransferase